MILTVLIPIYNTPAEQLIEATMSILKQDDGIEHHIILIDDCSELSETKQAIDFLNKISNRINVAYTDSNSGTSVALNYGHQFVDTEYVAIMGSDDISHASRFRKQIDYLKKHPKVDVLGTNLFSFYNDDIKRTAVFTSNHPEIPDSKKCNWLVNHGTVVYRNKAVWQVGGYNPAYKRGQDIELWGRMAAKGFIFRNITEVLYAWRKRR